jgi:hypothetical protein
MAQLSHPDARRDSLSRAPAPAARTERDLVATITALARPANDLGARPRSLAAHLSFMDWFLAAYFFVLALAIAFGDGNNRGEVAVLLGFDVALFVTGVGLTRGGVIKRGTFANGLIYRVSVLTAFLMSYFHLREILPQVSSRVVDQQILAFDLSVFGFEPALAWDRFVNAQTTEWFAFFYFSYFFMLLIHVFPMMLADRNSKRLAHFCLGVFMVYVIGHIGYMIVPGYGPYRHLAGQFDNELQGGLFLRLVIATVDAGGAQKDIFPSLHTAAPTFFAIFSYMHRRSLPFRYTWPIVTFFATQIILATMFLRWHWLIDVIAGLVLATGAAFASRAIVSWEWKRRARVGLPPVLEPLVWPKSEESAAAPDDQPNSC